MEDWKRWGLRFFLVAGASAALAAAPQEQLQFADGLFSRGLYDMALAEYENLTRTAPAFEQLDIVWFRLGECHRQRGAKREAEEAYRKVMADYPDSPYRFRAEFRRAELFLAGNQYSEAEALFQALLEARPPDDIRASGRYYYGYTLEKLDREDEAAAAYRTILDTDGESEFAPFAALALAQILLNRGGEEAEVYALLKQAGGGSATPRVAAEALFLRGDHAFRVEDYDAAAEAYNELRERFPDDRRAREARMQAAWSYYHAGKLEPSLQVVESALAERAPELRPEWLYLQANVHRARRDATAAVAAYDLLLREAPGHALTPPAGYELLLMLYNGNDFATVVERGAGYTLPEDLAEDVGWLMAESHIALDQPEPAIEILRRLVATYPDTERAPSALYRMGLVYQQLDKPGSAREAFKRLARRFPTHELASQSLMAAGACALALDDVEGGVEAWATLIDTHPEFKGRENVLFQMAMAELKLGRDSAAAGTLTSLLQAFPAGSHAAEGGYWFGVLLEKGNDLEGAEMQLRRALDAAPDASLKGRIEFRLVSVLQKLNRPEPAARILQGLVGTPTQKEIPEPMLEWLARYQAARTNQPASSAAAAALVAQGTTPAWRQIGGYYLGMAALSSGDREGAAAAWDKAFAETTTTREGVLAALELGHLALAGGETTGAERYYSKAAELASDFDLIEVRAHSYFGLGQAARARQDWEEAARRFMSVGILFDDPELTPEALYYAMEAFGQSGKTQERARTARELQGRYPDSSWAGKAKQE